MKAIAQRSGKQNVRQSWNCSQIENEEEEEEEREEEWQGENRMDVQWEEEERLPKSGRK